MILNEFFNLPQVFEKDMDEGTRERLSNLHDKIRKEKGLPDPKEYLKIAQQKKKEIADLKAQDKKDPGMEEGIFGSRPSPVLPVVDKIAKVASGLTPQNVEVGKQIIQNKASEITRMLSPQTKPGVDVIEQGSAINENSDVLAGLTDILKTAASRQAPQNPRYFAQQVKDVALQLKDNPATQKWSNYLDGVVKWADVISSGKEQYSSGFANEVHSVLGPATRAYQDALLNKQGVAEDSTAHDCKHCNGKGYHTVTKKDGTKVATNCPQCKGKGYIVTKGVAEATGDQKFDTMMSRITAEPKYPDRQMLPTSIPELIKWADQNNKPYHKFFALWARKHGFTNVNDALVWAGDNIDPYDEWGDDDEFLIDAAKHDREAAELLKVYKCYEEIWDDWGDKYRQMNMPDSRKGTDEGVAEGKDDYVPPREADYGPEYQAMVKRVGEKARAQEKAKQQPKTPVRESRRELLRQIIQS
jgi:hypothetical protein